MLPAVSTGQVVTSADGHRTAGQGGANQGVILTSSSGSRRFFSSRLGTIIVTAVITGVLVFVACFMVWHHLGGGAWLSEVSVKKALLLPRDRLTLLVGSCGGAPKALLWETDIDVQVEVIAFSTPWIGGDDCRDLVNLQLKEPLGDRIVVDKHTGQSVNVVVGNSSSDLP